MRPSQRFREVLGPYVLVIATGLVLAVVVGLALAGEGTAARWVGSAYALGMAAYTAVGMVRDILRGNWGVDVLAVTAIVSTVVVGEYVAALIVVLMLTGGEALEEYAAGRAGRELRALLDRAPVMAHRRDPETGAFEDVPVDAVQPGDRLLVRPAEVVPVDAVLQSGEADLDESSLTGESLPVSRSVGDPVLSGSVNGGTAIEVTATARSEDSQYQRIVALVAEADQRPARLVRVADRYAVPFTAVSFLIAGLAWAWSGDATRFAEVLVLATPCPLLIAAPVAFLAGMGAASRDGIVVRGGDVVERLAAVRTAAFDKTGTLTYGEPTLVEVRATGSLSEEELLGLAASAEQYSSHVLARSVIEAAQERDLPLEAATQAEERATHGVLARVSGREALVGKRSFVAERTGAIPVVELASGELAVYVGVDSGYAGALIMRDEVRDDAALTIDRLHALGVRDTMILTGDAQATADHVAAGLGIDHVLAECLPEDKVEAVRRHPVRPVMMVGDGVNDAPVLAVADVGVAMGARGSTAASESADVVVMTDHLVKVAAAVSIGQRTMRVALQSIWLGIALSIGLMLVAAFGYIPAIAGALLQEIVDLATIVNSLRARRAGSASLAAGPPAGRSAPERRSRQTSPSS
ncbi:cobalt ABC transporter ATP-binding protein [Blastococcus sp. CCUG 61487]|nr:cobalt ABC transporter ATP-binding protein [Blastococcus sp. CCUG 61487]